MLLPKILLLCAFCHQMVHSHTPASLRALANLNLHTLRAKALTNALNLRARAQYNAAVAKARTSNLGLHDHRIIRDSRNNFSGDEQAPEFDREIKEDFPFSGITDSKNVIVEHLINQAIFGNNLAGEGNEDSLLGQRDPQITNEDFIGRQQGVISLNQEQPCLGQQLRENANGDLLRIRLDFNELDGSDTLSMSPVYEDEMITSVIDDQDVHGSSLTGSNVEDTEDSLTCGTIMGSPAGEYVDDNRQIYPDSNAGIQLPLNQEPNEYFENNLQAAVPSMQIPSTVPFQNSNGISQFSTVSSTYPTTLTRQGFSESNNGDVIEGNIHESQPRTQENDALPNFDKTADSIARHHVKHHRHHLHKKFHGTEPLQPNIHIPTEIVSPGVHLHVVQNQNAVLGPQFATTAIHPGLHTAVVNPRPVLHDTHYIGPSPTGHFSNINSGQTGALVSQITGHGTGINQAQTIQTHSSPIMPSTLQFGQNLGGNIRYGNGGNQFQNIYTHPAHVLPSNQQLLVSPNMGGNIFSQTQTVHERAREGIPADDIKMMEETVVPGPLTQTMMREGLLDYSDLESIPQEVLDDATLGQDNFGDEKVGTFLNNAPIETPLFHYTDPHQPEDRQGIIKYIEGEQENIRRFLHIIENNNQYNSDRTDQQFYNNRPLHLHKLEEYGQQFDNTDPHLVYENNIYDRERDASQQKAKLNHKNIPQELDNARLAETNFQNEKVGTINMDQISENVEEFETDLRRHLQEEEKYVQNMLHQIEQNYQRDMDSLSSLIDINDRHLHDPAHFHDSDSNVHAHVEEVDIPDDDKTENSANTHQSDEQVGRAEDTKRSETLLDKNAQEDRLGYIIQVPQRRYTEDYQRQARSFNLTTISKLDKLLLEEKKVINDLKKDAKHDEDMMMIGYIGDSFINDLENRLNKSREKRDTGRLKYLPLRRLFTDPRAKFDVTKTLENLGAATRHTFEHEKAPLYHVRNMVGSAQDAVLATMKIPTKNFLIPSAYDIVKTQGENDVVGAINPNLFSRNGGTNLRDAGPIDGIMNTFQRVGSAIRGSVKSGQEALNHVGDVANHAKNAIHSTRYTTPRLILKSIPAISREPRKKAMLITPRIFDISGEDNRVGTTLGKQEPDFVKMGHILDAVGVSNPNYDVKFEKIVIEPRSLFSDEGMPEKPVFKRPDVFKNLLENIKIEKIKRGDDEDFVGNTLNALNNARSTVGANNLHDFIVQMRHKFKKLLNETQTNRKMKNRKPVDNKSTQIIGQSQTPPENSMGHQTSTTQKPPTPEESNNQNIEQPEEQQNPIKYTATGNPVDLAEETVGVSLLPEEIRHPFLGQATLAQREQFIRENYGETDKIGLVFRSHKQFTRRHNHKDVEDQSQTRLENLMKNHTSTTQKSPTLEESNNQNIEQPEEQQNPINYTATGNPVDLAEETVGVSLLPEEIRHPFLGQATLAQRQQFLRENNGDADKVGRAFRPHKQFMRRHNYEDIEGNHQRQTDRDLGNILGAINPMMFERIFNETLKVNDTNNTPHAVFHHHHNGHSHGHHHTEDESEEEQVGTSMAIKGQILKPFMGQPSDKLKHEFFDKYMPEEDMQETEDEEYSSEDTETEHVPELAQWVDIFHPIHESSVENEE